MNDEIKTGYKIVGFHVRHKKLYSCMSINWSGYWDGSPIWRSLACNYSTTKWTNRKKGFGPLCVFEDLLSAKRYFQSNANRKIFRLYECEYTPDRTDGNAYLPYKGDRVYLDGIPSGTVFANKVKLTKRIKVGD